MLRKVQKRKGKRKTPAMQQTERGERRESRKVREGSKKREERKRKGEQSLAKRETSQTPPRRKSKLAVRKTPVKHGKKTSQGRAER